MSQFMPWYPPLKLPDTIPNPTEQCVPLLELLNRECLLMQREMAELKGQEEVTYERVLRNYAPQIYESSIDGSIEIEKLVRHHNARIRVAAMLVALHKSEINAKLIIECERMIKEDPDSESRELAACCIGTYFCNTENHSFSALLAITVCDEYENERVRIAAYRSLRYINGLGIHWPTNLDSGLSDYRVDWSFVECCLKHATDPS